MKTRRTFLTLAILLSGLAIFAAGGSNNTVMGEDCPAPQPFPIGETYVERQPEWAQDPLHWTAKFVDTCGNQNFWDNGPVTRRETGPGTWKPFKATEEVSGVTIRNTETGEEYFFCSVENPQFDGEVFEGVVNPWSDESREPRCDLDRPHVVSGAGQYTYFEAGDSVVAGMIMLAPPDGRTFYACYLEWASVPGFLFEGVRNPLPIEAENAAPCQ